MIRAINAIALFPMTIICLFGATVPSFGSPITVVDQQNLVGATNTLAISVGQSFTPALSSIDAAEFLLQAFASSATIRLDVISGAGLGGSVLGSSAPQTITNNTTLQTIHFDLISPVSLIPGNPYTLGLFETGGITFRVAYSSSNPYAGGSAYTLTGVINGVDFVFTEGKHIPEPATVILAAAGLVGLAAFGWRRRKR